MLTDNEYDILQRASELTGGPSFWVNYKGKADTVFEDFKARGFKPLLSYDEAVEAYEKSAVRNQLIEEIREDFLVVKRARDLYNREIFSESADYRKRAVAEINRLFSLDWPEDQDIRLGDYLYPFECLFITYLKS